MAADPNLFAQFAQPVRSVADYGADMDKAAMNQLQLIAARQGAADDQSARAASISSGGDTNKMLQALQSSGNYKAAQALQKTILDNRKTQADIDLSTAHAGHFGAQTATSAYDLQVQKANKAITDIAALQDPTQAHASIDAHAAAGDIDPAKAQALHASVPQDPSQFASWQVNMLRGIMSAKERLDSQKLNIATNNTGGALVTQARDPLTGAVVNSSQVPTTQSPDNAATVKSHLAGVAMTQAGENARSAASRGTQLTIAGLKPDGSPIEGGGGLSEEARVNAAARYNMDGTLPPSVGRGAQGAIEIKQILNEAAHQAAARGDTPEAQRIAQLANKAGAAALTVVTKQEGVVGAAEKNFTANANMVTQLAAKVDNTGVPLLNKWINAGKRSVTGDPNISALDANIKATVNEYAKIVGGGTGGGATAQGEVAKIEGLLSAAQTPQQIEAVLNVMRQETANRMKSFKDQRDEITGRMVPVKATAPPAALPGGIKPEDIDAELARRQPKKMASGGPVGYAPQRVAGGPVFWAPQAGAMQAATPANTGMAPPPVVAPAPPPPAQAPQGFTLGQGYGVDQFGGDFNPPPMPPPVAQPRRAWGRRPNAIQAYADGGRVEPKVGTKGPVRSSGSDGGLSDNAIMRLLTSMPPPQPSDAAFVDPTNPRAVLAARMHAAGLYAHGGRVAGPGGPRDDEVPAMLSNGEHVMDAATVTAIGGGDNAAGQAKLNAFRKKMKGG